MSEKKIKPAGPDAGVAADRKKIETYLSSEAWEKRLAEARARREKVLSARQAASRHDRPASRSILFSTNKGGFAAILRRSQAPEAGEDPKTNDRAGAQHARDPRRRWAAFGAAGLIAVVVLGAIAAPTFLPESIFGLSGVPDPVVEIPDLARFGAEDSDPTLPVVARSEERLAAARSPGLPVPQAAPKVPDFPHARGGEDLARAIPSFPQPLSTGQRPAPSGFAARSEEASAMPRPATIARSGADEAHGMAAPQLPGLATDEPVFPLRPVERRAPNMPAPSAALELAGIDRDSLPLPDIEIFAMPINAAPPRPSVAEPRLPLPPAGQAKHLTESLSAASPAGRTAGAFPIVPTNRPISAARLTLDGMVESSGGESVAASLAPSFSLPSMPFRPQGGAAAPSGLRPATTPRLSALAPKFPAADNSEEGVPLSAPESAPDADPLPRRLAAPEPEADIAALGKSAMANAGRYRLTLHAADDGSASALHERLIGAGYTSISVTVSPFEFASTAVFYYHEGDARAAAQLARQLGGEARSAVGIVPSPASGALDIHVSD